MYLHVCMSFGVYNCCNALLTRILTRSFQKLKQNLLVVMCDWPSKIMVVPKTISNDVQPKSSLIMFLIDSSVSGNLSTQFYGSTLVARAIFSCL